MGLVMPQPDGALSPISVRYRLSSTALIAEVADAVGAFGVTIF